MKTQNEKKEIPAVFIAGGRPRDLQAMTRMMSQAFGMEKPKVAYTGTANGDNPVFFHMMKTMLKGAGAAKVDFVKLAVKKPDIEAAKKKFAEADVIFISGGEVEDGMNWLVKCGLTGFLKELYSSGKRFLGVSAGVIMMGSHWVHWDVPESDDTASLIDCLGFTPRLFDVHGEDEDWKELKTALRLLGKGAKGYALPSGCMISADSGGNLVNLEKEYIVYRNDGDGVHTA